MRVAFLILAHREPQQVARLVSCLRHPDVRVYLHVDRQVELTPFSRALSDAGVADTTVLLPQHRSSWGGIGVVDAQLEGLERGLADGCDYFLLLSGQDFPTRPVGEIVARFAEAPELSYVYHFALPDDRWAYGGRLRTEFYTFDVLGRRETYIPAGEPKELSWKGMILNRLLGLRAAFLPPRVFPSYVRPYGGWTWWNLSREAATYVSDFVARHPDYREFHRHTLIADEIFVHSILMGTDFPGADRVVNENLRFLEWQPEGTHPRTLLSEDLPAIRASGAPFARKFDDAVDAGVTRRLAELIGCGGSE